MATNATESSRPVMRSWFRVFLIVSLVGVAVALYQADYLRVPVIVSPIDLASSFPFLFVGFLSGAACWKRMLMMSGFQVSTKACIAGMGLSVFGKYIPGKIWTIAGRAAYVAQQTEYPLGPLTVASVRMQLLAIWVGLGIGSIGLCLVGGFQPWGQLTTVALLLLMILIFSRTVQRFVTIAMRTILRVRVAIPRVRFRQTLALLPRLVIMWGLWAVAFSLLARGLLGSDVAWSVGLGFPLAATLGVVTVICPGGIGVREGALTAYLVLAGVSVPDATTVAVASRVWFLIGEVVFFVLGGLSHLCEGRKPLSPHATSKKPTSPGVAE